MSLLRRLSPELKLYHDYNDNDDDDYYYHHHYLLLLLLLLLPPPLPPPPKYPYCLTLSRASPPTYLEEGGAGAAAFGMEEVRVLAQDNS